MDENAKIGNIAIEYAQGFVLDECSVVSMRLLPTDEMEVTVSGRMLPLGQPAPGDEEAMRLFLSQPVTVRVRVANGRAVGHEWDKIQLS